MSATGWILASIENVHGATMEATLHVETFDAQGATRGYNDKIGDQVERQPYFNPDTGRAAYWLGYYSSAVSTAHSGEACGAVAEFSYTIGGTATIAGVNAPVRFPQPRRVSASNPKQCGEQCENEELVTRTGVPSGDQSTRPARRIAHLLGCGSGGTGGTGGSGQAGTYVEMETCWGYHVFINGVYQYSVLEGCSTSTLFIPTLAS
ncbi:MAG: hypothetical protein HYX65_06210 [Gemmatimonadetes bacterium]|nr:hypothetical protein [Gemmatimonadota bacterium]